MSRVARRDRRSSARSTRSSAISATRPEAPAQTSYLACLQRAEEQDGHFKTENLAVPVVRWQGGGGSEVLRLDLPELAHRRHLALHRCRPGPAWAEVGHGDDG